MRLDGWKAIGAHFGRERSTVIRWEAERGLPVHRIPGKGRGSVFALTQELDAWLAENPESPPAGASTAGPAGDLPASKVAPAVAERPARGGWLVRQALPAAIFLCLASLATYAYSDADAPPVQVSLPSDPELAGIYLEARSDWAERSAGSITAAIEKLTQVTSGDPGFAPAYAALADCYVLAREFGTMADGEAFGRAQQAADEALRIDPDNANALRALGFIEYWWRGDRQDSLRLFSAAIAAAPQSAQTHFWFGNVLVDNGDFAAGLGELEQARLLEPGSLTIQTDLAWARYAQGEVERAERELEALRGRTPDLASLRDSLSVVYLERGDIAGFVSEYAAHARLRALAPELRHAALMEAELTRDRTGVLPLLLAEMEAEVARGERTQLPWPTMIAAAAGDRAATVRLLERAVARNEQWGSAWVLRYLAGRWRGDAGIAALTERLRAPPMTDR